MGAMGSSFDSDRVEYETAPRGSDLQRNRREGDWRKNDIVDVFKKDGTFIKSRGLRDGFVKASGRPRDCISCWLLIGRQLR
jgi:hypothetical protein